MENRFGLKQVTIDKINQIFAVVPEIKQIVIYGSRAKGNYRNGSDIDLVIKGEGVSFQQLLKIENELDDLMLPYRIDLSLMHQIDDVDLLDHIKRVGIVFYDKSVN
ncbi:MAG: nucleotidyltransferase domain-containing protein [Desulfatirhabdiaceae bacterium]